MNQSSLSLHCPHLFDGTSMLHDVRLHIYDGRVVALEAGVSSSGCESLPADCVVSPGLIDIQVNGGGGVLFNDCPTAQGVAHIALAHARYGTTALLPTLITDSRDQMAEAIAAVLSCIKADHPGVLGIHLEGPFLQPARKGIHREEWIATFKPEDVDLIAQLAADGITLVTLAPERVPDSSLRALTQAGVLVFCGHSDATYKRVIDAMAQGGLCGVTHFFNAMSQLGPRAAGVVGAALLHPEMWAGVILDGHHVSRESFAVAWKMRGRERTILVSDAMTSAGTEQSDFQLHGKTIYVREGRCTDDAGTLAGASITLADAVRIGVQKYGLSLEDALYCATAAPATLLKRQGEIGCLTSGARADLAVFDGQLKIVGAMQAGRWLRADGPLRDLGGIDEC